MPDGATGSADATIYPGAISLAVMGRASGFLLAGVALVAAACAGSAAQVDFSRVEQTPSRTVVSSSSPGVIRMAAAPVLSPLATSDLYQKLADYMAVKLDRPVELVLGKTYAEINDLVKSGDVTLALVCTNPYLQGQEEFGMELLTAPEVNGETSYYSLLIVGRGVRARSLADLRGTTFAFSDPLSNSGRMAPLYQLARMGESPDSFFGRTIFTYAHDRSVRAVAEGIVTGAAVDSLVFDYLRRMEPETVEQVRVVEKWGPFGISPIVVNHRLDPQLKAELRQLFLAMDEDSAGRELLRSLMVDRFVVPDDSIYDSVREMRSYLREHGLGP